MSQATRKIMREAAGTVLAAGTKRKKNNMSEKEQLQDMIDALTQLDIRGLDEETRDEAEYVVNDIIISLEELIDLL